MLTSTRSFIISILLTFAAQFCNAQVSGYWTLSLSLDGRGTGSVNIQLEEANSGNLTGLYLSQSSNIEINGKLDGEYFEFLVESKALGGLASYRGKHNTPDVLKGELYLGGQRIGEFTGQRAKLPRFPLTLLNFEDVSTETTIDVGGFSLKFLVVEGSLPAIVFENGGGMNYSVWNRVQSMLRSQTSNTLVSYNRAGIQGSSNYEQEYAIDKEIAGLHTGLKKLNLSEDIVLVGHSYGGLLLKMFAHRYPDSVQSLLFVDPNTTDFARASSLDEQEREFFDPSTIEDPAYRTAMTKQTFAFPDTVEKISLLPPIRTPCRVITSGIRFLPNDDDHAIWRPIHAKLAQSCDTDLVVAERSSHMIPLSEPELIVEEILKALNQKTDVEKPG